MKKRYPHAFPDNACYDEMDSPVGTLTIIASTAGLHAILWDGDRQEIALHSLRKVSDDPIIMQTKQQLQAYFRGERKQFDLPLAPHGTHFQQQAWQQLCRIPYGQTISYGEQAKKLGDKNKARAVGLANGRNPISIVVPCHRVIGSNGALVGFGGGLDKKAYLLELETRYA